jgi:hypothetical protein
MDMVRAPGIRGIDPDSWQVTLLPLPKRFTRGVAFGFCRGHAVGAVEAARAQRVGCWWPESGPELLTCEGFKDVSAGVAGGDLIPGQWHNGTTGAMGAVVWRLKAGRLTATNLHPPEYEKTWATAAEGGTAVGVGTPPRKPGAYGRDVGLVWNGGDAPVAVAAEGDVLLLATDGTRLAGNVRGRAALWPSASAAPVDLNPAKMAASEVRTLGDDYQAGVAFKGMCARAALWRGTAASFMDLTPAGFQTARILGAAAGYQVGCARRKDTTRNGSPGSDDRAVLWQGAADKWFDLNGLLPSDTYNASSAFAIEIRDNVVRICGEARRFEATGAGTTNESHVVPIAHPVLWTARLT